MGGNRRERERGERHSRRGRMEIYLSLLCGLLAVNLFFTLKLQFQIRNMNKSLNQVLSSLAVGWQEAGEDTIASRQETVEAPQYNSAPKQPEPEPEPEEVDYASLCGLPEIPKPVDRTPAKVLERLRELAGEFESIQKIYQNHTQYPEDMLKALANNPEMADFVGNYLTAEPKPSGAGLTKAEKGQEYPLFLQWDPRWGYAEYGDDSNIGISGCGPACLSMVLYYLLGDESLTPDKIAAYSMENGHYMSGTGTAWTLLEDMPQQYGILVEQPDASEWLLQRELDEGKLIICSMRPGDFTSGGHFIVLYGYDSEGFLVNDPNCVARSRMRWSYETIGRQIKHVWVYDND